MTRMFRKLALVATILLAPTMASALGISVVGVNGATGANGVFVAGDTVTVDLVVENTGGENLIALGIIAQGYDNGGDGDHANDDLTFSGGAVATSVFNATYVPTIPVADGMANAWSVPEELTSPQLNFNEFRVALFDNVSQAASSPGDGTNDVGVNGLQTNGSDVHFQVQWTVTSSAVTAQSVTLNFGNDLGFNNVAVNANGDEVTFNNDSVTISVIPEPGTALLMGLGLMGLAAGRRR